MAKCNVCNKEMKTAKGCKFPYLVEVNGLKYKRLKFGTVEEDWGEIGPIKADERCGDCGTTKNHLHHDGCDIERCPKCHGQLLSCDCNFPTLSK